MWEEVIAGAGGVVALSGGLMGLYVALRHEIRRSYELLQKDIGHLDGRVGRLEDGLGEVRADIRRVDQKIDDVRGELIGFLGSR